MKPHASAPHFPSASPWRLRLRSLTCAAVGVTLVALSGCRVNEAATTPTTAPAREAVRIPASLTSQALRWHACPPPAPSQGPGPAPGAAWECSTLKVPLDYRKPGGETMGLALIRTKAKDRGKRLGSLIFNFGGPGASGVATLPQTGKDFSRLGSHYDLVSFDPRGVGMSRGVTCLQGKDLDRHYALDHTPDNAAEEALLKASTKRYIKACQKNSGKILPHVGTESAARDIDLLRGVLGESRTTYFGISYGTELGAVYAHLFPDRVGRFVLDAAVDPTEGGTQETLNQLRGFQLALDHYMKDCAKQAATCPTGSGGKDGNARITALLHKLDSKPLPTSQGRRLTADLAETGITAALYSQEAWKPLTQGLEQAMAGRSGDILLALADIFLERDDKGRYSTLHAANSAIDCVDTNDRVDEREMAALLPKFREASPVFGESAAWGSGCNDWPVRGTSAHPDVRAAGAAPILVIGQTGDPATPHDGAKKLARALGDKVGVDISVEGEGHGAYSATGNPCLTALVDAYLLKGTVPSRGTRCA